MQDIHLVDVRQLACRDEIPVLVIAHHLDAIQIKSFCLAAAENTARYAEILGNNAGFADLDFLDSQN